ncbi:MAG: hypothetical protein OJF51_000682 [Nitrospira sp.]|nr:MAG: hypothetical protein OJF51_000682 [Nitrospira sp.]
MKIWVGICLCSCAVISMELATPLSASADDPNKTETGRSAAWCQLHACEMYGKVMPFKCEGEAVVNCSTHRSLETSKSSSPSTSQSTKPTTTDVPPRVKEQHTP